MTAVQCYTACSVVSVWYWPCHCQWWRKHGPLSARCRSLFQPHGSCWPEETKKLRWIIWICIYCACVLWTFRGVCVCVPGWSSWAGCLETGQLTETSRGLEGYEMRFSASTRCLLWNPPSPRKCCPPSGFRSIQLTYIQEARKLSPATVCFFPNHCSDTHAHTYTEKEWVISDITTQKHMLVVATDLA